MNPKCPSSRCLWKTNDEQESSQQQLQQKKKKKKETYNSILKEFLADPPPPKSLSTLCCNSLVVGQEFVLTCLFWARHRVVPMEEAQYEYATTAKQYQPQLIIQQQQMIRSQFMALMALIVIAIYTNSKSQSLPQPQPRKAKVKQRTSDAILLAILLRLLASVLRTLTASFSTDTVENLTVAGMVIHWLTCDYSYANATHHNSMATTTTTPTTTPTTTTTTKATTVSIEETATTKNSETLASPAMPNPTHAATTTSLSTVPTNDNNNNVKSTIRATASSLSKRPTFQGGTVSLNAAFFSTTLLASRLSSNVTVYIFVSSAIILFAFYPAARHAISHHPHRAWIHSFVTLMLSWSTFFLLQDAKECLYFTALLFTICGIAPLWKFWLQRFKRKISGPWDVVSVSEMMLDY